MLCYHTDASGDPDPRIKPFLINPKPHTNLTITCPYGTTSDWEPQPVDTPVICHCTSTYAPHTFTVKAIKPKR